jgi:hypothetical protein
MTAPYDFPAIEPASRSYGAGRYPITAAVGLGGGNVYFLHSSTKSGIELELGYENLTQAEAKLIRDHYRLREGGYQSFLLPSTIWAGHSSATNIAAAETRWKYARIPEETQKTAGYVDVTISLISVI